MTRSILTLIAALAVNALHATPIDLDGESYLNPPGIVSGNDSAAALASALGVPVADVGTQYWKDDGSLSGSLSGSYTSDLVAGSSTTDITISWVSGQPIITTPTYLVVKSGSSFVIHDISGWDGWMPITVDGYFNPSVGKNGKVQGVSHIALYGKTTGDLQMPDGGATGLLLGAGVLSLGLLRRRS